MPYTALWAKEEFLEEPNSHQGPSAANHKLSLEKKLVAFGCENRVLLPLGISQTVSKALSLIIFFIASLSHGLAKSR